MRKPLKFNKTTTFDVVYLNQTTYIIRIVKKEDQNKNHYKLYFNGTEVGDLVKSGGINQTIFFFVSFPAFDIRKYIHVFHSFDSLSTRKKTKRKKKNFRASRAIRHCSALINADRVG